MPPDNDPIVFDIRFLWEASKRMQGYLLHTWFEHYLTVIMQNVRRWVEQGVIGADAQPSEETDFGLLFDLDALDFEKLSYVIGFYLYILSGHKWCNYYLIKDRDRKRVLYLRGYDFEGAIGAGSDTVGQDGRDESAESDAPPEGVLLKLLQETAAEAETGVGIGFSSVDTIRFNDQLANLLGEDHDVFKVLSPRDLYWETIGPQQYFWGDYDKLISSSNRRIHSLFLSALCWQEDISEFVDHVDYFVVYVSSITASAIWELELLKKKKRAHHVTVVFDEEAIARKVMHAGLQDYVRATFGDELRWTKDSAGAPDFTTEELRDRLTEDFLLVTPDKFADQIDEHKKRISESSGPADGNARSKPIDFRFYPAVEEEELARIREFDQRVERFISDWVTSKAITNLPWFLNNVQLRIFTSLMLGEHDNTGRALAVYAAVMDVTRKHLTADVESDGVLSSEAAQQADALLAEHFDFARYAAPTLLGYGKSHEFGSYIEEARKTYKVLFESTSAAVEHFYEDSDRLQAAR